MSAKPLYEFCVFDCFDLLEFCVKRCMDIWMRSVGHFHHQQSRPPYCLLSDKVMNPWRFAKLQPDLDLIIGGGCWQVLTTAWPLILRVLTVAFTWLSWCNLTNSLSWAYNQVCAHYPLWVLHVMWEKLFVYFMGKYWLNTIWLSPSVMMTFLPWMFLNVTDVSPSAGCFLAFHFLTLFSVFFKYCFFIPWGIVWHFIPWVFRHSFFFQIQLSAYALGLIEPVPSVGHWRLRNF